MTEPLTAEELWEADWFDSDHELVLVKRETWEKLVKAAEEAERLRAAIERHKKNTLARWGGDSDPPEDRELWEAMK